MGKTETKKIACPNCGGQADSLCDFTIASVAVYCHQEQRIVYRDSGQEIDTIIPCRECEWCGVGDVADEPYKVYDTGQVQYLCESARCLMRHHAYNKMCACGWWHSDQHCPKCGQCETPGGCKCILPTPVTLEEMENF